MRITVACLAVSLFTACTSASPRADAAQSDPPAPTAIDSACNWQTMVLPHDRSAVEATAEQAIARIPSSAKAPDYLGDDLKEASLTGIVLAHALLQRARTPLPVGDVSGAWRVRSVQASGTSVYDYPFFKADIQRAGCGFDFRKTTGSQRRTGRLLPISGSQALAFLGTGTVNQERTAAYDPQNRARGEPMGPDGPVNSAGRLLRIGQDDLLMILDLDENGFELYHLQR